MTPKQREVYDFLSSWLHAKGYSPSLGEIALALGMSKVNAHRIVGCLQDQGKVTREPRRKRSIAIVKPAAVQLSPEIMALTDRYASSHGISRETAANELLRAALEAA